MAIGGTSLDEWSPYFIDHSYKGINTIGAVNTTTSRSIVSSLSPLYHDGCHNIFGCALRSLYCAIRDMSDDEIISNTNDAIGGIVWYQGENDASVSESYAETYGDRLQSFIGFLRMACSCIIRANIIERQLAQGRPKGSLCWDTVPGNDIPFVLVAITSTSSRLPYIKTIRRIQLDFRSRLVGNCRVIDTLGANLLPDGLHLCAESALVLGHLMAVALHSLQQPSSVGTDANNSEIAIIRYPVGTADTCQRESLYSGAAGAAIEHLTATRGFLARSNAVSRYMKYMGEDEPQVDDAEHGKDNKIVLPVMSTKLKAVNFVYGELSFSGMSEVIERFVRRSPLFAESVDNIVFIDLGCGDGVSIAAAALSGIFRCVLGIEMMKAKANTCFEMSKELLKRMISDIKAPEIEIIQGNFLNYDWWNCSNVVYAASTCFSEELMASITEKCTLLQKGSIVIFLDKPALLSYDSFTLEGSFQAASTWGQTNVFVFRKS